MLRALVFLKSSHYHLWEYCCGLSVSLDHGQPLLSESDSLCMVNLAPLTINHGVHYCGL